MNPDTPRPGVTTGPDTPNDTPTDTPLTPSGGPTVTLSEAVTVTGVSRSTLQRRLRAGDLVGAHRTPDGWAIPIAALIAAGYAPRRTPPDPAPAADRAGSPPTVTVTASPPTSNPATDELVAVRAELERTRAALVTAETLAAERARHLDDLRAALEAMSRALPPGPTSNPATRTRWWHRGDRTRG